MIDNPRIDLLIARYGRSLAIAAIVVGVLTIVATGWVVATPSTTTTTQQVEGERITTDVQTSAFVVEDGLWEAGTELEDSSVYLVEETPVVTIRPQTTVPTDDASVDHRVELRLEVVRDGDAFWEDTDELLNTSVTAEDGLATSEVSIDVPALEERRNDLEADVEGVGRIAASIHVHVDYDTGSNTGQQDLSTSLQSTDRAYWFGESMSQTDPHPQTVTQEVTEPTSATFVGGMALLALASFGTAGFVTYRSPVDVDAARRAVHERRYAEWISHGTIPMWIGDHHVALDTLADVVDVAIDTNERVVHDRQRGLFAVVSDDVVYYYSDRGFWEETAWPDIDLGEHQGHPPQGAQQSLDTPPTDHQPPTDAAPRDETAPPDGLPDPDDDDAWNQV